MSVLPWDSTTNKASTIVMHAIASSSAWVSRFAPLVPKGDVLDLACGTGRHARVFAAQGHRVIAVDRDPDALSAVGAGIETLRADVENAAWPLQGRSFSGIVVTNYLHRPLFPVLLSSLAPGGVLIYETFACGNEQFGRPSNPDFLLLPGELVEWVCNAPSRDMRVIAYEDGYVRQPKPAMVQRICAIRRLGSMQTASLALD